MNVTRGELTLWIRRNSAATAGSITIGTPWSAISSAQVVYQMSLARTSRWREGDVPERGGAQSRLSFVNRAGNRRAARQGPGRGSQRRFDRPRRSASLRAGAVVEIAARHLQKKESFVLVLDEPQFGAFAPRIGRTCSPIVRQLRDEGGNGHYISSLNEVLDIADRITVMRGWRPSENMVNENLNEARLIAGMIVPRHERPLPPAIFAVSQAAAADDRPVGTLGREFAMRRPKIRGDFLN